MNIYHPKLEKKKGKTSEETFYSDNSPSHAKTLIWILVPPTAPLSSSLPFSKDRKLLVVGNIKHVQLISYVP